MRVVLLAKGLELAWRLESRLFAASDLYDVVVDSYLSPPMDLEPGQMIFTELEDTKIRMPEGRYAILAVHGDIVQGDGVSPAPLSSVYDHHWIIANQYTSNPICGEAISFEFGIGSEARWTPTVYPAGYGRVVEPDAQWGANIHLLHTVDLEGDPHVAAKECNECWYAPGKGSKCTVERNGTFQCCGEHCDATDQGRCFCPAAPGPSSRYYLRYNVTYTRAVHRVVPVENAVLAAPGCQAFYDVYRDDAHPYTLASMEITVPRDVDLVYAQGHQHVGSVNISLVVNGATVCTSYPQYGTEVGKVGNERGYVVKISRCLEQSMALAKGDKVRVDSWYFTAEDDPRIAPTPGGTHLNVMGYMIMAWAEPRLSAAVLAIAAHFVL